MTTTDWQPTACILCECNCGIVVQVEDRTLARIRGDKEHPGSQGYTCNKALRLNHYQNNRARLTSPMRRRPDGTFEEIDWDTAIIEIAEGFKHIRDTYGGDKIFYYGGGGQGNHLGGAYSGAFLKALGAKYRSNALAQEKTGEAWVDAQLYGGHTRGEFEHAEVSVFVGKNPWMSQSFPRARVVLNEIAKDPARSMIVIDPVVTDTAKMADFHLRVFPGTDAWCLAALAAILVQENLCNEAFLAQHVHGVDAVRAALREVPVADYAQRCGVDEELLRTAARRIATAGSVAVFEDLGVQQGPNSTLCSYLNKLLWILTGNFAKKGGQHLHSSFAPLFSTVSGRTPVTGAPIIAGLVPANAVPEEILTDHPDRFRAMIVESGNPAHSLADSTACRKAFQSLELMVVVDVAMTETARLAHYVLPAASQFEKPEATFFNFEFPHNGFQLRRPLLDPLPGTLPEPEIWARLVRALGVVEEADLRPLREAAREGRQAFTEAFLGAMAANPTVAKLLPYVLYETLGPTLPEGMAGAAAVWGLAQKTAMTYPDAVRRAGYADGNALFDAILDSPSGVTFTVHNYEDDFALISHSDRKIALEISEMLDDLEALAATLGAADHVRVTDRAFRRGAARLYRKRHLPRPVLAQTRCRRSAAGQCRRCPKPGSGRRRAGPDHHRGRQCRGDRRDHRDDAARACRPAQRLRAGLPRRGRPHTGSRGRPELAHLDELARRLCRHPVAQARARADRSLPSRHRVARVAAKLCDSVSARGRG